MAGRKQKRVALVIGNGAYEAFNSLENPPRDAPAVEGVLRRLGFEVFSDIDLTKAKITSIFDKFKRALRGCNVGLIFYSGHGIQIDGTNYIVPVEANLRNRAIDFVEQLVPLQTMMIEVSKRAEMTLVFLDACRANPYADVNLERQETANAKGVPHPPLSQTGPGLAAISEREPSLVRPSSPTRLHQESSPGRAAASLASSPRALLSTLRPPTYP